MPSLSLAYLIRVIKAIVHEPCYQGGLADYTRQEEEAYIYYHPNHTTLRYYLALTTLFSQEYKFEFSERVTKVRRS